MTRSPEWLSGRLRRPVVSVASRPNPAFNSLVHHLDVTFADGAVERLLLKQSNDGHEVAFYGSAPQLEMLVRCLDADFDAASGESHLLLEDVSATHRSAVTRERLLALDGVPDDPAAIAATLGRLHAHWWGRPPPGPARWLDDFDAHVERRRREWARARAVVPEEARRFYDEALRGLPSLAPRLERAPQTLIHGDCYLTQWLVPVGGEERILAIDFDSWSPGFGAFDLAFLLATFWTPAQRARHEDACLQAYVAEIPGYSMGDLLTDYALMLKLVVWDAVFDVANGSDDEYWWPKMQCLMAAARDHDS